MVLKLKLLDSKMKLLELKEIEMLLKSQTLKQELLTSSPDSKTYMLKSTPSSLKSHQNKQELLDSRTKSQLLPDKMMMKETESAMINLNLLKLTT